MNSQVSRMLDDEHRANIALLGQVEQMITRHARYDAATAGLVGQLVRLLENDVDRHFSFEEEHLFPRMAESGDGGMAALMQEEHEAIREVCKELLPLARQAAGGSIGEGDWSALRPLALELVERQVAHIQKETMALLPLLDDLLDEEADRELAFAYTV
ncbi:hemerythrin domain-containing protein [Ramlibacter sp.]|uniref:hemerythrin domain-containing protein n=1 Tax=Ramlibacter sp. TaxID=1917967 RepID=UPI002CC71D34|nr:hemerythrin domain-containing protein [Ramlibacter sp.]HWI80438.1 hemerythrin domain-containing protein [Ramlibacter sp.]